MSTSFLAAASTRARDATRRPHHASRIWCVSDVHSDHGENLKWCQGLEPGGRLSQDTIIVAGDLTPRLSLFRETLLCFKRSFKVVFFTAGNHDLWVKGMRCNEPGVEPDPTSLARLEKLHGICRELGVMIQPAYASGAIICPIASWYHASWDTEPDIKGWKGIPRHDLVMTDFGLCVWPSPLSNTDDSVARRVDGFNDDLVARIDELRASHPGAPLITFSHFVPHVELNPEKRFLFFPGLAKACGSAFLARRIAALQPDAHVFGHTHFGWDATLADGVRYLQAPLSYPEERKGRLGSVATGDTFPHAHPPTPLLVYDASTVSFPPRYDAGWSNWYRRYPRRPDLSHILAPYVASQGYERVPGVGEVGWFGKAVDPHTQEPLGEPLPAWQLGPESAVAFERSQRASNPQIYGSNGGEAGRKSPAGSPSARSRAIPTLKVDASRSGSLSPSSVPRSPNSFQPLHGAQQRPGSASGSSGSGSRSGSASPLAVPADGRASASAHASASANANASQSSAPPRPSPLSRTSSESLGTIPGADASSATSDSGASGENCVTL